MSQERDALLKGPEYGALQSLENAGVYVTPDNAEVSATPSRRLSVIAGAVVAITITAAVVLSSSNLTASKKSVDQSLATFAVVNPGEMMRNKDELWPCVAKQGGSCPQDNMYDAFTVPFKMVFYNGDVMLFAKARSASKQAWGSLFELLTAANEPANSIGWGEPYWKLSEDPKISGLFSPSLSPQQLMNAGLNNMIYRVNEKNQPQIAFQKASLINDEVVFEDLTVYTGQASPWGCDKVTFLLTTDGNLLLVPYSTLGVGGCNNNLPFISKNYKALGGTTRVPTAEPTYGPGMPTPAPTPTFEPTLEPTVAKPTSVPTPSNTQAKKKNGGKKNNKKNKNKKKNRKNRKNKKKNKKNKNKRNKKKNRKNKNKNTVVTETEGNEDISDVEEISEEVGDNDVDDDEYDDDDVDDDEYDDDDVDDDEYDDDDDEDDGDDKANN